MIKPAVTTNTRRHWAAALLASSVLTMPAFACQNPSFAEPRASLEREPDSGEPSAENAAIPIPASYSFAESGSVGSVVGLWHAILRIGDERGPVYDEVLEQFHADGTELLISSGLPPALGNVCIGVWKRVAARTFKLKHMTWNWAPPDGGFGVPGTFAGHFELDVTLRLDARGAAFSGTWTARNFGLQGEHLPALDAQGVVTGVRIGVD
jgi:hypothetical protein